MPSTRLDAVTLPASKKKHPRAAPISRYACARPEHLNSAPSNFGAIGPCGARIGGGHRIRIGGIGIPGSIGAVLMAFTSAVIPCDADQALLYGCENWKSLVPRARITSANGE